MDPKATKVHIIVWNHMKRKTRSVQFWFRRRSAIELVIGYLKTDNRMSRSYLKGREGDQISAVLCACGYNLIKLLAVFFLPENIWQLVQQFALRYHAFLGKSASNQQFYYNLGFFSVD